MSQGMDKGAAAEKTLGGFYSHISGNKRKSIFLVVWQVSAGSSGKRGWNRG